MKYIIILLGLPVLIKLFTKVLFLKVGRIQRKPISAEMIIANMNRKKIRSCRVEKAYNITYFNFNKALKNKEITRDQILAIRYYLEKNVHQYQHKKFENDCHFIYTALKAKDISVRDLEIIGGLIA